MWDRPGYPLGPPVFALVKCVRHIATTQRQARSPVPRRVLRCAVMRPAHRAPWGFSLLAGVLIAAFLAQSFLASAIKSPVFDESAISLLAGFDSAFCPQSTVDHDAVGG